MDLRTKDVITLLQNLIRIPSENGNEKEIGFFLHDCFLNSGFASQIYDVEPNRPAVVAVLQGKSPGKTLLFTTHYDTHVTTNMEINPFDPKIQENLLYGRGSCDAKGSIAAMIISAIELLKTGRDFVGQLMLAFVPDEEYLNKGTTYLMEQGIRADWAVVGEPTEMVIGHGHRGCTHLDVIVKGKAYHSAFPEKGINAIEKMADVITALRKELFPSYESRSHPYLGHPVVNLGLITGGTRIHTVADQCCASFLRRDLPGENTDSILEEIQLFLNSLMMQDPLLHVQARLSTIQQRIRLPFFLDPAHPLVTATKESYRQVTGLDSITGVMNYYCDASILYSEYQIPTVIFGPGSIQVAHSAVEYIELDQLLASVKVYTELARTLLV